MEKILIVEDNATYRASIYKLLKGEGYDVDAVADAITGIEHMGENKYALVITDLMMELMDGNRFSSFVKRVSPKTKIIILTGQPSAITEIMAIENKVDKYLTKGIRLDVLLKYVQYLVSEFKNGAENTKVASIISVTENLELNVKAHTVTHNGVNISVTTKEFGLLYMFLSNKGNAIRREEFIEEIWDKRFEEVEERVVDVHIKILRKKLKLSSIVTIRGYGYKWDE
ncbi:two-component regulatory system response regulator PhoP [Erysipelotrichaceae bacterium]|nr:two-component regulatory system response regulator PhoP [Erysipelotrichaceae bacterium]